MDKNESKCLYGNFPVPLADMSNTLRYLCILTRKEVTKLINITIYVVIDDDKEELYNER